MSHIQENIVRFYSKFNELRTKEKYTDVTLQCESQSFKCHRLVLTVASAYFETMFEGNFKESTQDSIMLQGIHANTLEEVLNFMYTGDVHVDATNVYELLRMGDYYGLPGMEGLCLRYIANNTHQLTIQNLFPVFLYACNTKKKEFVSILSKVIAEHFSVCCQVEDFLEVPFDCLKIILDHYLSLSSRNEELLMTVIIQWTHHKPEERLSHFAKFFGKIDFEKVSPAFLVLMTRTLTAGLKQDTKVFTKPAGCNTALEFPNGRALATTSKALHVYVKYEAESLIRIFSINSISECTYSGEILLADKDTSIRCVASDDFSYLYSLNYLNQVPSNKNREKQTFCVNTSVDRRGMTSTLTSPPIVFCFLSLCYLQNNIFAYNASTDLSSVVRTNSKCYDMFNEEEIKRGIFVYNCSIDNWFPVPQMKKVVKRASMTACGNTLYLIGGEGSSSYFSTNDLHQAYDFRAGWRMLPASDYTYENGNCCSLNGKIYVCGGVDNPMRGEIYDPVAGKWERIESSMHNEALYQHVIPFENKLWVMGSYSQGSSIFSGRIPSSDLSVEIYDTITEEWSNSWILEVVATDLIAKPTTIVDGIVFSVL